ncbi:WGR and DUF4132 domain-containing protein [Streptomyces sp. NBC_01408]|uniref:WGR and DUF4132 domain-containing protein n=1 Tax=Streptomyces sp. NBC_01408 TaxID=2903855 RepID=UPI00224DBF0F|nr:DUF4132 domain-containing protein [Streptomyces sp. NBC_01408]MCX4695551.1 DUF4132 domain-containing protein [Streptomyces sp. NBC_01408]
MQRWEYVGESSAKFWEAGVEGASVTIRFGRSGTAGRTQVKEFDSPADAASYLVKSIAEKERKGYAKTGSAVLPEGAGPSVQAPAEPVGAAPVLPDEDTFTLPVSWKRNLHPRRGGVPRTVPEVPEDAQRKLAEWLRSEADAVERVLSSPRSEAGLVEAARAHQGGSHSPLGAAVLATPLTHRTDGHRLVAEAWADAFGLPFAACAVVELVELQGKWVSRGSKNVLEGVETCPENPRHLGRSYTKGALDRIRALLAVADEETYRAAVAALALHRKSPRRSVSVSYLVPSEQDWVEDCCARPGLREHSQHFVREMLVCSLGTPEQAALFGGRVDLGWPGWNTAVIATVAEGVGPAMAQLLAGELDGQYVGTDEVKTLAGALAELPSDEAFGLLLDRSANKHVRPPLIAASHRFPVRALHMLARASQGSDNAASMARQLLSRHVAAHRDIALAVLPDLPEDAAAIVAPLVHREGLLSEASPDTLPALLTSPPWTRKRRAAAKPRVVEGLTAPTGSRVEWRPGERESWAATESWISQWQPYRHPLEHFLEGLRKGVRISAWDALGVFTHGPAELVRPVLLTWRGTEHSYEGPKSFKPLVAAHELAALPVCLRMVNRNATAMVQVLLPFVDAEVARVMADCLARLKTAGQTARTWFARHGAAAAGLLVPDALGAPGEARTAAERALTLIAATHGADTVREAAAAYGAEAAEAIGVLLASDPLESALPARMPKVAEWADPHALPQLRLVAGGALPAASAAHVVTMLAISKPGQVYPGLAQVRELCTKESLTVFVWALFGEWQLSGMPPKEAWALHALGWFGDDETVRALTPVIRSWPGEGAHQRAVEGLDVLASIGTDVALMHLHGIAQRVKFKALKLRAQEKISEVAAELGLTAEQLADRLVPDFGLDADGSTVVDYGTRRFTVGFDERLVPYVRDESGRPLKDLPKPGVRDDAELAPAERKRFTALKKDVRTIASDQVRRLEAAMVERRTWTGEEFRRLFVEHPLVWHLVRRLVWLAADAEGTVTAFRVAEDRTYADAEDEAVTVPDTASVSVAHPLHLSPSELAAWSELFADYEILQPFPQLGRPVLAVTEEEAGGARLTRFEGVKVPVGKLLGMQKRGWERGEPQDAGVERWFSRRLGPECHLVIALDEGIAVGMVQEFPDQVLETIWLDRQPCDHYPLRAYPMKFADLDPVIVSEVLADLTELTS